MESKSLSPFIDKKSEAQASGKINIEKPSFLFSRSSQFFGEVRHKEPAQLSPHRKPSLTALLHSNELHQGQAEGSRGEAL